jgi:hypothetical protein
MTKRARFILTSVLLALGFIGVNLFDESARFYAIGGLCAATLILFVWSLREGLKFDATILSLVLPILFTLGVGLFWFLIPTTVFARIPVILFYAIGVYSLALTANIFTVSTIRTIALVRAARGVGFVLTLLTSFLMFDAIWSLKTSLIIVALLTAVVSLPLFMQGLWVSVLERKIEKRIVFHSLILSTGVVQMSILLYFWPVSVVVGSLFLTVTIYVLLGLGQAKIEGRLFKRTVREYLSVGTIVFIAMYLATHWG